MLKCYKNIMQIKNEHCDEKIHLYYFYHFICNLVTRFYYLIMCLILNLILISILYIIFIYMLHLHVHSLCYMLSTCLLSLQSFCSKSHSLSSQCTYSSFNYIFVNAIVICTQYHLSHSLYHIQYFVFNYYIQYLLSLFMRSFIIFVQCLLFDIFYHFHTYSYTTFSLY